MRENKNLVLQDEDGEFEIILPTAVETLQAYDEEAFWKQLSRSRKIPKYEDLVNRGGSKDFNQDYLDLLEALTIGCEGIKEVSEGMAVSGKVLSVSKRDVVIDIGYKDNVYVDNKLADQSVTDDLKPGQFIDVLIIKISENPFSIRGSISELVQQRATEHLSGYFDTDVPIEAKVIEAIPAGYMLDLFVDGATLKAFMPNTLADVNRLWDPASLVGKEVKVLLETLQQDRGVYVVSRKKYLQTLIDDKAKDLKRGVVYTGHVTGTTPFGVFVQFEECLTGMIHRANIVEEYREKIETIRPGTLIDFYVRDVIRKGPSKKIILTQILRDSLWDEIKVGMVVKGKVVCVKPFGALVELDPETNGLIQTNYLQKCNRHVEVGQEVEVKVISLNRDDRKIYLTFSDDASVKPRKSDIDRLKDRFERGEREE